MKISEAIEILKGDFSRITLYENESHSDKFAEAFNMAIEALENTKCEYDCKNCWKFDLIKPHWIPCSERLPENIKTVLITVKELEHPTTGWYGNKFGWRITESEFANTGCFTVIAWMPLPEPYKESED